MVTGNHRSWRHMIELRTAMGAEEEIRLLFLKIAKWLSSRYVSIYEDMEILENGECRFEHEKV